MEKLYPGKINSPATTLSEAYTTGDDHLHLSELSSVPAAPNTVTVGSDESAVTFLYTGKSASSGAGTLTGVSVLQGTDKNWDAATVVSRTFTAYDWDSARVNLEDVYLIPAGTAGEDLVPYALVYLQGADGKWWKTDSDAEATTTGLLGIWLDTTSADATGRVQVLGQVTNGSWSFSAGDILYVSATPGSIATSEGTNSRKIGFAISATRIMFIPEDSIPGSGAGDVIGPASSTDDSIARFNGTDNKTIQGSLVTIDDSGSVNIPLGQSYKVNGTALAASDVGALASGTKLDDLATPDDNTDLNASISAHGLLVKATAATPGMRNVVGIDNGETAYTNKALFDATNPEMNGSAAPGSAMTAARRDHVHDSDTSRAPANPLATDSLWDAAGDLVVGTGANTAGKLAIGTAGQVLKVNVGANGLEWGAAANAATVQTSTISILTSANDDGSPLNALDIGCNIGIIRRIRVWGTQILGQRTAGTFLINNGSGIAPTGTELAYDGLVGTLPTAGNEATGDYIWIDNELCRVSAGTSTPLTIVRGLCGTVGAFHDDNAVCRTANEGLRLKLFSGNAESEDNLFFDWRRIYTGVWTTDAAISAGDKVLTLGSSPAVLPDFGLGDFIGIDDGTIEKVPVQAVYGSVAGTTYDDSIATLYALGAHDTSKTVYRLCQWDGAIPFKLSGTATNLYISIYPEQLLPGSIDVIVQFLIEKLG